MMSTLKLEDIQPGTVLWRTPYTSSGYGTPICSNTEPSTVGYVASGFVELGDPVTVLEVRSDVLLQSGRLGHLKVLIKSGLVGWVAFCQPHWTTRP